MKDHQGCLLQKTVYVKQGADVHVPIAVRSDVISLFEWSALGETEENHKKFPFGSDSTTKPKPGLYEQRIG